MNLRKKQWRSRISIVTAGVMLGYAARFVLGAPEIDEVKETREFDEPLSEVQISDLPILQIDDELELLLPDF